MFSLKCGQLLKSTSRISVNCINRRWRGSDGYIVLLPEMPPEKTRLPTFTSYSEFPEFSSITEDKLISSVAAVINQSEWKLHRHVKQISDGKWRPTKSFESIFEPIEEIYIPLMFALGIVTNLRFASCNRFVRLAAERLQDQATRVINERYFSEDFYLICKELRKDLPLSVDQKKVVDITLNRCHSVGVGVSEKEKTARDDRMGNLRHKMIKYRLNVAATTKMFRHDLSRLDMISEAPAWLLFEMAVDKRQAANGPWRISFDNSIYGYFMAYCNDRLMRWNCWRSYTNRASPDHQASQNNNYLTISELRQIRHSFSEALGFNSFAEMAIRGANTMARDALEVGCFIEDLKDDLSKRLASDLSELNEFANVIQTSLLSDSKENSLGSIQPWDVPYWTRRYRQERLIPAEIHDVFSKLTVSEVLNRFLAAVGRLLQVKFEDCTSSVSTWNESVCLLKVHEERGGQLGAIYIDPFRRPSTKTTDWMAIPGRLRSAALGLKPFVYAYLQFPVLAVNDVAIGSPRAVVDLQFYQDMAYTLGSCLYMLMIDTPLAELNRLSSAQMEMRPFFAYLMRQLSTEPFFLRVILPEASEEQLLAVQRAARFMQSWSCGTSAVQAAFDMELHLSDPQKVPGWGIVHERAWRAFLPESMPPLDENNESCSDLDVFVNLPGLCYSSLMSRCLAAQILEAVLDSSSEQGLINNFSRLRKMLAEGPLVGGADLLDAFCADQQQQLSVKPLINAIDVGAVSSLAE